MIVEDVNQQWYEKDRAKRRKERVRKEAVEQPQFEPTSKKDLERLSHSPLFPKAMLIYNTLAWFKIDDLARLMSRGDMIALNDDNFYPLDDLYGLMELDKEVTKQSRHFARLVRYAKDIAREAYGGDVIQNQTAVGYRICTHRAHVTAEQMRSAIRAGGNIKSSIQMSRNPIPSDMPDVLKHIIRSINSMDEDLEDIRQAQMKLRRTGGVIINKYVGEGATDVINPVDDFHEKYKETIESFKEQIREYHKLNFEGFKRRCRRDGVDWKSYMGGSNGTKA